MRSIYSPEVEPSVYLPHFFFNQLQMSFQRFAKDVNPSDIRSLISSDEMHSQAMVTNRWVFFALPRFVVAVTISTILVSWRILPKDLWGCLKIGLRPLFCGKIF